MVAPLRQDSDDQSEDEEENHLDMKGMFNVEASEEEKINKENSEDRSSELSRKSSFKLGKDQPMAVQNESNVIRIGRSNKAKLVPTSSNEDEEMGNSELNSGQATLEENSDEGERMRYEQ